jgi:hypothetical protein
MEANTNSRFKSGDVCPEGGLYEYDGYVNGAFELIPYMNAIQLALRPGDLFPPIRNPLRESACYWMPRRARNNGGWG